EIVRWPREAAKRDALATRGVARLLLVEAGESPPDVLLDAEDWLRVPADERDMFIRLSRLKARTRPPQPLSLELDDLVLRHNGRWVALSPIEAGLVAPLLARFGHFVATAELAGGAWDDGVARAMRTRVHCLRRRLAEVGLRLTTVRGRGYVLER